MMRNKHNKALLAFKKELAAEVEQWRKEAGMSQHEMSSFLGYESPTPYHRAVKSPEMYMTDAVISYISKNIKQFRSRYAEYRAIVDASVMGEELVIPDDEQSREKMLEILDRMAADIKRYQDALRAIRAGI